jgi:hypothetical protein
VVLDAAADGVQRPHPGVAHPGEHQLAGDPGADHLVVDHVGGEPAEGEVALALADHLVPGGERDQVREPLDRQGVAVANQFPDRCRHADDLAFVHTTCP